jgi:hypothetical protein
VDHGKIVARDEEHLVDAFSTGMTAVFAYNPWLLPWFMHCYGWRKEIGLVVVETGVQTSEVREFRSTEPSD